MAKKTGSHQVPTRFQLDSNSSRPAAGPELCCGPSRESGAGRGSAEAPPARTLEPRPAEPVKTVLIEPLDLQDEE